MAKRRSRRADTAPVASATSATSALDHDDHAALLAALDTHGNGIGIAPLTRAARGPRRRMAPDEARRAVPSALTLYLVERAGVLSWQTTAPAVTSPSRSASVAPRRRAGSRRATERLVTARAFEEVAPDAVHAALQKLDDTFTPSRGLRRLTNGRLVTPPAGPYEGRTLLVIHGTFSNADNVVADLQATDHGRDLLGRAEKHYDRVLFFDHPTLAQGPLLNAIELERLFAGSTHAVDVVCHSRGGLVARWWLETFAGGRRGATRAVLVGSPVAGTSLAAGPRIRGGIDAMTTLGNAVAASGQILGLAAPFLAAPVGLLRILLSITGTASRLPIPDALMAAVPGLFAQSRIGNNSELRVLRGGSPPRGLDYFTVTANFEPAAEGWRFWRYFRRTTAADMVTDVVFDGPNDLVVDTDSMGDFGRATGIRPTDSLVFGTTADIHHCNYFRTARTGAFIAKALRIG